MCVRFILSLSVQKRCASQNEFCSCKQQMNKNSKTYKFVSFLSLFYSFTFAHHPLSFNLPFCLFVDSCLFTLLLNRIVVSFAPFHFNFSLVNWICTSIGVKMFVFFLSVFVFNKKKITSATKTKSIHWTEGPHKTLALIKITYIGNQLVQFVVVGVRFSLSRWFESGTVWYWVRYGRLQIGFTF